MHIDLELEKDVQEFVLAKFMIDHFVVKQNKNKIQLNKAFYQKFIKPLKNDPSFKTIFKNVDIDETLKNHNLFTIIWNLIENEKLLIGSVEKQLINLIFQKDDLIVLKFKTFNIDNESYPLILIFPKEYQTPILGFITEYFLEFLNKNKNVSCILNIS